MIGQAAPSIMDGVVEEDVRKFPSHLHPRLLLESFSNLMLAPRSSVVSMSLYKVRYSPVAVTSLTAIAGTPVLAAIVLVV